jgi:hypothetical protein
MVLAGAAAALATATLPGATASSDSSVVVRGLSFPAGSTTQLNVVGCDDVFRRTAQLPAPMIGLGAGKDQRSVAFSATGGGSATGAVSYVDSIVSTTVAGMSVYAESGTTGVAYVGYQAPADARTSRMWIGRSATLTVPAGDPGEPATKQSWTNVDAAGLVYTWAQYDMTTHQRLRTASGTAAVSDFADARGGDGPGFYAIGFGCDGHPFNTDLWRFGGPGSTTTYDFEGYAAKVTGGKDVAIAPGDSVTLTARVGGSLPGGAAVVLESKQDDGDWAPVRTSVGPNVSVTLRPHETTTYRWKIYNTPMVAGAGSAPFTVTVEKPSQQPSEKPSQPASEQPSAPASAQQTQKAPEQSSRQPSAPASQQQTEKASQPATPEPTPSESPSETPTAPQSGDPSPAAGQASPAGEGSGQTAG